MKSLIISDTHFGVKNNSMTWLKSQLSGIDEIIEYISNQSEPISVVHCGDLFDSRSSVSPYVMHVVKNKLIELCNVAYDVHILGGNHDYYSSDEKEYNITSLDFISGLKNINNLYIYSQRFSSNRGRLFIPWFDFHNPDTLQDAITEEYDIIYTHTDLGHLPENIRPLVLKINKPIVSGHVHQPNLKNKKRITVGSCYSLDFADNNSTRGFYIIEDNDIDSLQYIPLKTTIKFHRLYNDDIFGFDIESQGEKDKVEVYIDSEYYSDPEYKSTLKTLTESLDVNIIINPTLKDQSEVSYGNFNILDIIERSIPDHLKEKFDKIKCRTI